MAGIAGGSPRLPSREGEEAVVRAWRAEDAGSITPYAANPAVARNMRDIFPHPYTRADAEAFISSCISGSEERQLCRAIAAGGRAVGGIALVRGTDVYFRSAELGYWLAEEYWGRGIMTRAVERMCREAFARWDIVRIYAEPFAYNTGSRRVLEKAGFVLEGIMRRGACKNGRILDYCMYALLRDGAG